MHTTDRVTTGQAEVSLLLLQTMTLRRKGDGDEDEGLCSICMDRPLEAQISGCDHQVPTGFLFDHYSPCI